MYAQTPDASLLFPITTPTSGTSVNTGVYNEVIYNHNGASSSSSSYTNCATFTSGNVMRIGSSTTYFEVNTPNGKINKIEIRIQSNSSTAANAIVAFSNNGTTWSNFSELTMPANNANPSCQFHTIIAPANMKFFRIARASNVTNFPGSTYTPVGTVGQTIRIFEMYTYVDALVPTIITSTNALPAFLQVSVPSPSQSYSVSGTSLTNPTVDLNAPVGYQISTNNITWTNALSLPVIGSLVVGQPQTIYVRLNDNVAGPHSGNITHTSTGAAQVDVAVTGNTVITPILSISPSTLSFGNVYQGSFSAEQFFTVQGIYLTPASGNVILNAPTGYQISTASGTGYSPSLNLPYTGSTLNLDTIYIRFFPSTNGVFNGNVVATGGGAPSALLAVDGTGTLLSPSAPLTNLGIDFWTGFGYHQRMSSSSGAGASLSLYISAQQAATVRVSIPGITDPSFPKTINIPANSAVEITGFPTGTGNITNTAGAPDSRLYFTGITNRGIHIESLNGVPVAAYEHTYGTDCAGATLLLPTNTWGATYNVLSLGGTSNTGVPNSFFFVMAKDDNTQIEITPTVDIIDSSAATLFSDNTPAGNIKYPAGVPFTITLNKGQIFNAMSRIVGSGSNNAVGQDLTGTLVKTTDCENKKIAVWGGNGRTFMNTNGCTITSGSDNVIQQMLPKVAWGTKYLTTPTKTMEYGIYRIYVSSPTTVVKLNGTVLPTAGLINNFYYQIESNQPCKIEGDKPLTVSQFVVTANCKNASDGNNGTSDPEMIILSPVQQAIKNASVFSAAKLNITASGGSSYINVILKNGGTSISSFRIDGLTTCDTGASSFTAGMAYQSAGTIAIANAFKPHPQDANYLFAKFKVASGVSHNITSDSGFNAIAYGLVNGESYGYNAGTALKDLSAVLQTHNPYDTVPGTKTCKNNPTKVEIAVPNFANQIDSIKWDLSTNANVSPNGIVLINAPVPIRTYIQDEITYNVYQMTSNIVFSAPGIYRLYATVYGTFSSECGSKQVIPIDMEVVSDTARFNFALAACGSTQVTFTDQSSLHSNGSIKNWQWNFGDATSSTLQNPPVHNYPSVGIYNASLRIINEIGCFTDTTRIIDLTGGLTAKFGFSPNDSICVNNTIIFTDSSTSTGTYGPILIWHWNFGDGATVNALNANPQPHTYTTAGTYIATLQVETAGGCLSNIMDTTIVVMPLPLTNFTHPPESCINNAVTFTNTSTIASGTITQYNWNFGDPASGASNMSTAVSPSHLFSTTGTFTVSLSTISSFGCVSPTVTKTVTINQLPTAGFTFSLPNCTGQPVTFTNTSVANSGTISTWYWDYGNGIKDTLTNGNTVNHTYNTAGTYTVSLIVKTDKGCVSNAFTQVLNVSATPVANFTLPANLCLPNASATFTNTTTISDGIITTVNYVWDFGDGSPTSTATSPTHIYTNVGPFSITLTATSNNGCSNTITKILNTIFAKPVTTINAVAAACINSTVNFTETSTAANSTITGYAWNFGDPASGVNNTSSLQSPTHSFATAGTYTVSLTVTNAAGCSSNVSTKAIIINNTPVANFTIPAITCAGATIAFTDASIANSTTMQSWSWNFGDAASGANNTSSLQNPTHIFTTSGNYTVTLTVTNSTGCTSIIAASQVVTVNPIPFANFTASNICVPNGFAQFTNTSTVSAGIITNWLWNFADPTSGINNISTLQNPTHPYTTGGVKNVQLTVTSNVGCIKDTILPISVYDTPIPLDTIFGSYCSNEIVTLVNRSVLLGYGTVNKLEIYWDYLNNPTNVFTDNAPIFGSTYNYQYPTFGNPATKIFRVLIRAFSGNGCSNDYFSDIIIKAAPKVQFNSLTSVCQELNAFALNAATDIFNNTGIGLYTGNGIQPINIFNPANAGVGTHLIKYTFTGVNGCKDSASQNIIVHPTPIVNLGPNKIVIEGDAVTLNPVTSTGNNLSFIWSPTTFLTSAPNVQSVVSLPTADITYTLEATSQDGCKATDDLFIKVVKDFVVPNAFSPNGDAINDTWIIDNLALYPEHRLQIYNRYGQLLYDTKQYTTPWNGTIKGTPMPVGTYYYVITLGSKRAPKKGSVSIIR